MYQKVAEQWPGAKTHIFTFSAAAPRGFFWYFYLLKEMNEVLIGSVIFLECFLAARLFIITKGKLRLQFVSVWGCKKAIISRISN